MHTSAPSLHFCCCKQQVHIACTSQRVIANRPFAAFHDRSVPADGRRRFRRESYGVRGGITASTEATVPLVAEQLHRGALGARTRHHLMLRLTKRLTLDGITDHLRGLLRFAVCWPYAVHRLEAVFLSHARVRNEAALLARAVECGCVIVCISLPRPIANVLQHSVIRLSPYFPLRSEEHAAT